MIKLGMLVIGVASCLTIPLYGKNAKVQKRLDEFFDKYNTRSNVSSAGIYEGQKAGYVTGGNLSVRNSVIDSHPITVNLPKFDAGCGGIDLYAGGFSFIKIRRKTSSFRGRM